MYTHTHTNCSFPYAHTYIQIPVPSPTYCRGVPQINPTPFPGATLIPFLCPMYFSAFCFLSQAPCLISCFDFCFVPYLLLCYLCPPQSSASHMQRLLCHLWHPCCRLATPVLHTQLFFSTCTYASTAASHAYLSYSTCVFMLLTIPP